MMRRPEKMTPALSDECPSWHANEVARIYVESDDRATGHEAGDDTWLRLFPHFVVAPCGMTYTLSDCAKHVYENLSSPNAIKYDRAIGSDNESVYCMIEQCIADGTISPSR